MQEFFQGKYRVLVFFIVALFALVILAAELRDVEFRPIVRVGTTETTKVEYPIEKAIQQIADIPVWKQIVLLLAVFLIVLLISVLLSAEMRKRLIRSFLKFMAVVVAVYLLLQQNPGLLSGLFGKPPSSATSASEANLNLGPPPVFQAPRISSLLAYLIAFGVMLLVIALIWWFSRWWIKQSALLASQRTLDDLASAARDTLHELSTGRDSEDAIIHCYQRMSQAVEARRGLYRENGMTASEFAARLATAGLPPKSVHRLTHLFEVVRYGAHPLGQLEINDATQCLTEILQECGEAA